MTKTGDQIQESINGGSTTGKEILYVIKIGGNIIDDEKKLSDFLQQFAKIGSPLQGPGVSGASKILIHGGGKLATKLAEQMNIPQQMVDGRRITDAETLKIVTMVYAGYINKNVVAQLQANDCNAIGLCGADGNIILAHKRKVANSSSAPWGIDYGFAGDVDAINTTLLKSILDQQISVVLAPITHDQKGQLLNTNADTIAQEIANAMSTLYDVQLIYSFEKSGVLLDANDDSTVIPSINPTYYQQLKTEQKIFAGMIPKLDNAFAALDRGVKKVIIGKAEQLTDLITGKAGTSIVHE
jgi:acetylglutamate kinase